MNIHSALQKLSIVEKSSNEMFNQLATQLLNNLSLILIGLNKNAEALSLFSEATERNPRMFTLNIFMCMNYKVQQLHYMLHVQVYAF